LEEGKHGLAFASGLAAATAVFHTLKKGDHVVAGDDLYGGTIRLLENIFKKWGLTVTYVPVTQPQAYAKAVKRNTRLIWLETPTNPLLKIVDIQKVALNARKQKIRVAVDNTFASPYLQKPLSLGADLVMHSTTKYLSGHSDVVGGALVMNDSPLYDTLKYYQVATGAIPGPWDCWLTLRGLKTLAVRMKAHSENALFLARLLTRHPAVESVGYPGLIHHPGHAVAKKQMSAFGGMIALKLKGGRPAVDRFLSRITIFTLGESLGGVESLVSYSAGMSHASVPREERLRVGITDNLLRLSVGIEDKHDLKDDLWNALK
jgi:cystathionine gamma-synthase/cystathionine gamma-lyase